MNLLSPVFENEGVIPKEYTCDGVNTHPPLEWNSVPKNARSLVLIMEDPDAVPVAGKVWDHWIIFNIPPRRESFREGESIPGVYGKNTMGLNAYAGPCPPDREHEYVFTLYALSMELGLGPKTTKDELLFAMQPYIIEKAQLVGRYGPAKAKKW